MKVKRNRKREIEEAAARCVAIVVLYHNSPKTHRTEELFAEDIQSVARWASETSLSNGESERGLLRPLLAELIARYGEALGTNLRQEFLKTYRDAWRTERSARRTSDVDPAQAFANAQRDHLTGRVLQ